MTQLKKLLLKNRNIIIISLVILGSTVMITAPVYAATVTSDSAAMAYIAAALAVGLACLGSGIAIYGATTGGSALMAERPEMSVWVLLFAGLGEGLAIYGFVIAILIVSKL